MTTERVKNVRFFATREEMNRAYLNREKREGEVFALEEIDTDILADFLATPWVFPSPDDGPEVDPDSPTS